MLGVSRAFLSTLLPALRGERHFGVFTRDQPDIAGDLLATSKALRGVDDQHEARAVVGPTPGCAIRRNTSGRCLAYCSTAALNSSIVGFNRSNSSSKSCRRRAAQGASESDSNWARPDLLHSAVLRRIPSFMATACN